MKKLTFMCCCFLLFSVTQSVKAQGNLDAGSDANVNSKNNVSGIYTQSGFISTPWAAEIKSVSPAVKKKSILKETKDLIESLSELQYKYAMMLNVNVESLKNNSLLGFIDDWFGTSIVMEVPQKKAWIAAH